MHTDIRTQLATFENSLRRYLPEQLFHPLFSRPSLATARPCSAHLDALLHAVSTYLPRYLVNELLHDPKPGQVNGRFRETTIMFADISGFTAMSERLSRKGEQGAEKITNIVGDYFTAMLDITAHQGGDLLKFGGDALLVAFFGDDHAINACRAAAQMQQAIARFSQVEAFGETFGLKMTVGLGSGPLFTANLGTVEKMEYTVMGEALVNMAHAEDQAEGGEIFIDGITYQAVTSQVHVGETRNGCYKVIEVQGSESPRKVLVATQRSPVRSLCRRRTPASTDSAVLKAMPQSPKAGKAHDDDTLVTISYIQETTACLDALVPFLPPGLLDLLRFDPTRMASREKGEFRPVTVFFANFYGIEEIIQQLGPDKTAEITAILNAHFSKMQEIIHRYEGVIDKVDSYVVGHRIMALFGAPRAHVDDPERAVRAAWEMQAAMSAFSELETSAGTFALKQRIGINTGRVFAGNVGSDARHEYSVMGDEVNLTARLMSAAQEGQVLISQSTATQIGKRIRLDEKEPVRVKGKSQPVPNYEVRGIVEHIETRGVTRRSPLVGRDEEWKAVWRVAQQAIDGNPQVLDIHGEMGMGKSRVIEELIARWTEQGGATLSSACLSYGRHTPYAPWTIVLREIFGLRDLSEMPDKVRDSDQERREKITGRLVTANPEWVDWAALVAQLLGVPMPESDLLKSLDPKLRQQNLQRIVTSLLTSEAEYHPTLLIVDDIQWIDEASLAMLNYLITHLGSRPLLICVAYRPAGDGESFSLSAAQRPYYTSITLEALSEAGSLALLDSQLPTAPEIPQRLKELILKNAQGTPLFIVEMAHALIENYMMYDAESNVYRARTDLDRVQVPDTVSRVILSRLDRLDEQSRNMLKVASVIGRVFQQWLLHSVYPYDADQEEMEARLLDMCAKEILGHGDVVYLFQHIMTRQVAYESLLYAERRELHKKIAQSIDAYAQQGTHLDEYQEVLAEHYTLAGEWPQALQYHLQAGRRAQAVYANEDAIHRHRKALEIAQNVPDSSDERLAAYEGLGDTYQLVGQYDESLESYAQAHTVLDEMPVCRDTQCHRADLCRKTGRIYEHRSEYGKALEWVERGLQLLQPPHKGGSPSHLTGGQAAEVRRTLREECIETAQLYLGGAAVFHREGRFQDAIRWCHQSLEIAERPPHLWVDRLAAKAEVRRTLREAQKAAAHAYYLLGYSHHRLGATEKAGSHYQHSLNIYQALEDSPGMARAQNNLANFYFDQDDWERATEHYQQALSTLERIGDLYGQAAIANNLGGVLANRGQLESARTLYQRSLDISQELGISGLVALLHSNLGHTYIRSLEWDRGLAYLDQSLEMFQRIGFEEFLTELYRRLAEAHLGRGDVDRALSWAEKSLARSLSAEMKLEEGCARRVLGSIHYDQGLLAEAKAQLEQSLDILKELNSSYEEARTTVQLAALYADEGEQVKAAHLRRQAIAIFQGLGAELDLSKIIAPVATQRSHRRSLCRRWAQVDLGETNEHIPQVRRKSIGDKEIAQAPNG